VYATYTDFNTRYSTKLDAAEIASHYLPFASARLDSMLAPFFTVPFSSNNVTARDLAVDLAYLLVLQRSREKGDGEELRSRTMERIQALAEGREAMLTDSGQPIYAASQGGVVWSNTARYRTIFSLETEGSDCPHTHCPDGTDL